MYQEPRISEDAYLSHIDTGKEFELTYWSRRFGIGKARLRELVALAGGRAADVRAALGGEPRIAA